MTTAEKIDWMRDWCTANNVVLELEGEVGFGRPCVGILAYDKYPDYEWYDDNYDRADKNGDVWTPEGAYYKHPCVAVLGRGDAATEQLYNWLKWFDDNGFKVVASRRTPTSDVDAILHGHRNLRMVKNGSH